MLKSNEPFSFVSFRFLRPQNKARTNSICSETVREDGRYTDTHGKMCSEYVGRVRVGLCASKSFIWKKTTSASLFLRIRYYM